MTETPADLNLDPLRLLIGSRIASVGMNLNGEIFLITDSGSEFVFGRDGDELALYHLEYKP